MGHPRAESAKTLTNTVIGNGYCIGCGACAAVENSSYTMEMNNQGQYQAIPRHSIPANNNGWETGPEDRACPFSDSAVTEDTLGTELFATTCSHHTNGLGYHRSIYAGHVSEGSFREKGSSGGFGSWILSELLASGRVDRIIHVRSRSTTTGEVLFGYEIAETQEQISAGGKSRYYPVELSQILDRVKKEPGRYAIIGLPCFIKSIRLLQREDAVFRDRIAFCIGLVCGHLKSTGYADSLAWQMGIPPDQLTHIDFRVKESTVRADRYCTLASSANEQQLIPTRELFGTDWGAGTFKYKACDFCDDVFAETADVVLGDAWLPQYVHDSMGTNLLVVRNPQLEQLIADAVSEQRIVIEPLSSSDALASQDAGLRHRRDGLQFRLHVEQQKGNWVPKKRLPATENGLPRFERQRQLMRIRMREVSHSSFLKARKAGNLSIYLEEMKPIYRYYKKIKPSLSQKVSAKIMRLKSKITGRP